MHDSTIRVFRAADMASAVRNRAALVGWTHLATDGTAAAWGSSPDDARAKLAQTQHRAAETQAGR